MRTSSIVLLAGLLSFSSAAFADGLGTLVTGTMHINNGSTNYFDPANGFVPAGDENSAGTTVVITPLVEFGYDDTANKDTANFHATTLTFKDVTSVGGTAPIEFSFFDPAFSGFTLDSNDFSGLTYSFSGHTLNFSIPLTFFRGTDTIVFDYTTAAATPEPGSLTLLGTGILSAAAAFRRRILA